MGNAGTGIPAYPLFAQALESGSLQRVENIARMMPRVSLADSLRILVLMAHADDERYERAALRWLGRYATEHPGVGLEDVQRAAAWLDALGDGADVGERLLGLVAPA